MDAAYKLFKNSVPFSVLLIALLLSAPAWAQPQFSLSSSSVTCSGTSCPGGDIAVNSTGAQITYTVGSPDYSGDTGTNGNWLRVSPSGGGQTTPGQVIFSLGNLSGLAPGTHTATVTLTSTNPASGVTDAKITVTYSTSGGGGGGGTLASSLNPIVQSVGGGSSLILNSTISTTSATPISISIGFATTSCGTNWLTASNTGSSTISQGSSTNMQVTLNASGLSTSTCQGSITITPSAGSTLTVSVTMNVNGGGGSGSLTASVNPISLTFPSGTTSQNVTISGSTTSGQFNASVNCVGNWLAVNGTTFITATVGTTLTVAAGSAASGLATGNYTCYINLADTNSPGIVAYTITVNLAVNGGSTSGLTINPNSLSFSAAAGGSLQSTQITVTSQSGGVLSIGATSSPAGWLSFNSSSTGQTLGAGGSATATVYANPSNLSAGTYSGSLTITVGTQTVSVPVTFIVGGGGTGGGATIVAPSTVSLSYQSGTLPNFVNRPSIAITGPNGSWSSTISYVGGSSGWLSMSPSSGTLPGSNQTQVVATPTGLSVGNYSATITITTTGGTATVTVNLAVVAGPVLLTTPGSALFFFQSGGSNPQGIQVNPANSDGSALSFTATASDTWVSVTQQTGSTVFSVNADPTGKSAGVYTSSVSITEGTASNNPLSFPVVLVVNGGGTGSPGPLSFTPSSLTFSSSGGTVPNSQVLAVSANAATTFTVTSSATWLTVTPTSGTTNTNLSVSANPTGLSNNTTYTGTLTFNSNGTIQTVGVTFVIGSGSGGGTPGNVTVTCVSSCGATQPSMTFSGQAGAGALPVAALSVASASGTANVSFTAQVTTTSGGNWLSTSIGATTVTTPFNPLSVNVNVGTGSSALAAGTYSGNIAIVPVGGTTVNVAVTLTVTAPATVSATPTTLSFSYRAGDAAPAAQTINVSGGGGAVGFSVATSPSGTWLAATPVTGTTTATGTVPVTVTVDPTNLTAGTYTGTVTVAGTTGVPGTTTVNVTLTVTAPLPTVAKVVNAASFLQNSVSPGEIITLFASDAQHPIGPTTPVGLALDNSGKVATTLGGVQVSVNGFPAPLIYVSATQISAVAPYEIAPLAIATVLVKYLGQSSNGVTVNVATTSPGLFTLNSTGSGPGAILNQNGTVNAPNNPATRGDTVALYLTGEGQTSPAGVTGKVTTVSSTPPLTPGPLLPISVLINSQPANFTFAGEAPSFVSGVLQLNVVIPSNLTLPAGGGDSSITVSIGGNSTQTGVTIAIH